MRGNVKFFNEMKNFGFIEPDEGNNDVFVHRSAVQSGTLNEGDVVEFEIEAGDRGPKAVNVKKV